MGILIYRIFYTFEYRWINIYINAIARIFIWYIVYIQFSLLYGKQSLYYSNRPYLTFKIEHFSKRKRQGMGHINNRLGLCQCQCQCQCHLVICNLHHAWPWYVVPMYSSFVPSYITVNTILGLPLLFNFYGFFVLPETYVSMIY